MSDTSYDLLVELHPGVSLQSFQSSVRQRLSGLTAVPTIFDAKLLSEYIKDSTSNQHLTLQLLSWFALLGVIVAVLSVYAITTLMILARTKEIGIRMAVGAQGIDVFRFLLWRGLRTIIIVGLPIGLFLALISAKFLSSFLVHVNIGDPVIWIISCAVLICITIIAVLIPALRAARLDPLDAMRNE